MTDYRNLDLAAIEAELQETEEYLRSFAGGGDATAGSFINNSRLHDDESEVAADDHQRSSGLSVSLK